MATSDWVGFWIYVGLMVWILAVFAAGWIRDLVEDHRRRRPEPDPPDVARARAHLGQWEAWLELRQYADKKLTGEDRTWLLDQTDLLRPLDD